MGQSVGQQVSIVVTPRERFGKSIESLETIIEHTPPGVELLYVDGGSPRSVRRELDAAADRLGFSILRSREHLAPNHARILSLEHVHTPYIVFVDNDLMVTPGWLEALVRCADETGAWAVGPLYFEGDPADQIVHMAGGVCGFEPGTGGRRFTTEHRFQGQALADVPEVRREACDFVEFHCVLVRRDALDRIGGLDAQLVATREHLDMCLRMSAEGGEIWFEPASRVTYSTPPPVDLRDVPFFLRRWSESWSEASLRRFVDAHGIEPAYLQRLSIMRDRRLVAFIPAIDLGRKLAGDFGERAVRGVARRLEPRANRLLFRDVPSAPDRSRVALRRSRRVAA